MGVVIEYAGRQEPPQWDRIGPFVWDYRMFGGTDDVPQPDVVVVPAWKQVEVDVPAIHPGPTLFHCHRPVHFFSCALKRDDARAMILPGVMLRRIALATCFGLLATDAGLTTDFGLLATGAARAHSREFWRSLIQNDFTPPHGSSASALAIELSQWLASPDPELRDEIAYEVLAAWIYQKRLIEPDTIRVLTAEWTSNLEQNIGARGGDTIFRRSFSALALAVVAARDDAAPFMEHHEFRHLLDAALKYLAAEKDLRGYDTTKGWMHSAAHTADLLKFLARNRYLDRSDHNVMLQAIADKLSGAAVVFTYGEDERFARVVLSLIHREDFDLEGFRAWLNRSKPALITSPRPTQAQLRGNQNRMNLLAKLEVLLALDPQPSEAGKAARDALREALRQSLQ